MRVLLLIKWVLILVFTAMSLLLATPLIAVFLWSNQYDTKTYLKHMLGELRFDMKEDFLRIRYLRKGLLLTLRIQSLFILSLIISTIVLILWWLFI